MRAVSSFAPGFPKASTPTVRCEAGSAPTITCRSGSSSSTIPCSKVLKVLRTEEIEGVPTVVEMEMESPRDTYRTRVEFSEVDYNQGLDDSIFTVGHLQKTGK